jgi:hypothetical protein
LFAVLNAEIQKSGHEPGVFNLRPEELQEIERETLPQQIVADAEFVPNPSEKPAVN